MVSMIADNFYDRLYVGGFSTNLSSEQIRALIAQAAAPFEVSIEIVENGSRKHRGFAFVQCKNPTEANALLGSFLKLFTKVNFAKKEPKPADNVMKNVSNVFVRGISRDMTDAELQMAFGGAADGVSQCHVADGYGFVLFETRDQAARKIAEMDGKVLNGKRISVTWARPEIGGRKRKRPSEDSPSPSDLPLNPFLTRNALLPSQLFPLAQPPVLQPLLPLLPPNFPLLFPQNPLFTGQQVVAPAQPDLSQFLNFLV